MSEHLHLHTGSRRKLLMPSWILWLSPVIVAPLLAVLWTVWASRERAPEQALETVEQYDRFRAALTAPDPQPDRARRTTP